MVEFLDRLKDLNSFATLEKESKKLTLKNLFFNKPELL